MLQLPNMNRKTQWEYGDDGPQIIQEKDPILTSEEALSVSCCK